MPSSVAVLEYFILEANEYIDRLDNLVASAGASGPDPDSFGRYARALRGSATMSKQYGIADVAAALERLARALRSRVVRWDHGVSALVVSSVDDLRILIHAVRTWGADEERRAQARTAELDRVAPPVSADRLTPPAGTQATGTTSFLASETAELARLLDRYVAAPGEGDGLAAIAERVRALRGVADLKDLPPLPEVVDALERALKRLELAGADAAMMGRQQTLFSAAATVLRSASRDMATRGRPSPSSADLAPFNAAVAAVTDETGRGDRIVPISQLFFEDAGPHVVSAAPQPPTTVAQRFRMEVVSQAEHLRRVVADSRANRVVEAREHHARELRSALRALGSAANSFGEKQVAKFAAEWHARVATLNDAQLVALDQAAALLADARTTADDVRRGLERFAAPRTTPARAPSTSTSIDAPAGAPPSTPRTVTPRTVTPPSPRARMRTPTGKELQAFLQDGLEGLGALEDQPLSQPVPAPDEMVVPIEQLLYRGRAALKRATELRDRMLGQSGPPAREDVQELFDLLDLALVE